MAINSELFDGQAPDNESLSDSELASILNNELTVAQGSNQDDINSQRATALNYYFGRIPGDFLPNQGSAVTGDTNQTGITRSTEGNSNAVSLDVADMTEAMLAQIMPTFSQDIVASFEAMNPEDEKQANQESEFVNYQIMQRCDGYVQFYEAIKNALLMKNGIVKVYVDEYDRIQTREFSELSELEFELAAQQLPENVSIERVEREDGTVVVKRRTTQRELKIEAVDPINFRMKSDQRKQDVMDTCNFCAERKIVTQSWLISRGIDPEQVRELPTEDVDTDVDELARNQSQEEDEHYWYEASSRPIEVWECYIRVDYDRDGYGELRRVLLAGDKSGGGGGSIILENDEVDWIPYATGTPFLNPGRWLGISLFDKIKEIQDQKTDFIRQYINNMRYHNNKRLIGVSDQVNWQSMVNSRPGGAIEEYVQGAVRELQTTDIGPSCQNILNYLDKMRAERGGASLDMQTQGMTVGGDTAHGVERQMSFKEMMAGMVTKTLGETLIKQTYLLCHRTLRAFFPEPQQARIGQDWTNVIPAEWPERQHVSIQVGLTPGERMRKAQALREVLGVQQQAMEGGQEGVFTDKGKIYNTASDLARVQGIDNVDRYFIDPDSEAAQQAAQQNAQSQQMAQQQAAQMQMEQFQQMLQVEYAKIQQEVQKNLQDHEIKVAQMLLDSEEKQAEMTQRQGELDAQQEAVRNQARLRGVSQ